MRKYLQMLLTSFLFIPVVSANSDFSPLSLSETQYWVYGTAGGQLTFNSPWDNVEGDAIKRDMMDLPAYAVSCMALSASMLETTLKDPAVATILDQLLAKGASKEVVLLVNVVPSSLFITGLRKLDRDAYFSHWNTIKERPHLALSNYKKGQWLWEVIATEGSCTQPDQKEVFRYLDYALQRISAL